MEKIHSIDPDIKMIISMLQWELMVSTSNEDFHKRVENKIVGTYEYPRKEVWRIFRYLLTGKERTPSSKELLDILGKETVMKRLSVLDDKIYEDIW